MSVAFRRESDDEHMEPKFEIPLPPGPNWVTARGMRMTRETVAELEAVDMTAMDEEAAKKHKRLLRYWRTRLATALEQPVRSICTSWLSSTSPVAWTSPVKPRRRRSRKAWL